MTPPITPPTHRRAEIQKRVARILRIAALLTKEPRQWSRPDLAARFVIGEREIDRDLEILRGIGYIVLRRKGGYEIAISAGLPEPPGQAEGARDHADRG